MHINFYVILELILKLIRYHLAKTNFGTPIHWGTKICCIHIRFPEAIDLILTYQRFIIIREDTLELFYSH
jgi:hypothetical protein